MGLSWRTRHWWSVLWTKWMVPNLNLLILSWSVLHIKSTKMSCNKDYGKLRVAPFIVRCDMSHTSLFSLLPFLLYGPKELICLLIMNHRYLFRQISLRTMSKFIILLFTCLVQFKLGIYSQFIIRSMLLINTR